MRPWIGFNHVCALLLLLLLPQGSVSLVPGGIAEMFLWEEDREVIKVLDRKGFVRLAVEQGVPLVPVYHFGNSKLFRWAGRTCRKRCGFAGNSKGGC
jgi:2-acylglycerol O-acyltransferase 2